MSATSIRSSAPDAGSSAQRSYLTKLGVRAFHLWHLLSLDAPTVAVVWAWAFARTARVEISPAVLLTLGLSTWVLYVLDRLLDGLRPAKPLRERHHFHARHRRAFLAVLVPASALLLWLAAARIDEGLRRAGFLLGGVAAIYLWVVHRRSRLHRGHPGPKESAVALVFAAACATPAWCGTAVHGSLFAAGAAFALLCWLNCFAIETWELPGPRDLRPLCVSISAAAFALVAWPSSARPLALCAAASAGLLALLDRQRDRLAPTTLRAAADAVLLTPLLLLLWH